MSDRWPSPLLIGADGTPYSPLPVPVGSPPFSEAELQAILEKHPGLLPVDQLDQIFGPAVCIGREVATDAGPIDLMYVAPSGYLTIVETKLWKTPDARRKVVAQIIDYTKHVVEWSYDDLQERFGRYAAEAGLNLQSLCDHVAQQTGQRIDESDFYDGVTRCLRQGRLLLLIVGDGIREGVEQMASFLQGTPHLQFTLGLVEIGCFRVEHAKEECLLLVPRVVARTAEITRAVVQIEMSEAAAERITTTIKTPEDKVASAATSLSEREFYDRLVESTDATVAEKTQQFVRDLLAAHDALDKHITLHMLKIRFKLPTGEYTPRPMVEISRHGAIRLAVETLEAVSELGLPQEIRDSLVERVAEIDELMIPPTVANGRYLKKKGGAHNLRAVVPHFDELNKAVSAFVEAVQRVAEEE